MKQVLILSSALFVTGATIKDLYPEKNPEAEMAQVHVSLNLAETRAEQIQKCASCHRKQYENEMLGPHAASYKNLAEHVAHAENSPNFPPEWKAVLKKTTYCMKCHGGDNLYETVFSGLESETDESKFTLAHYPSLFTPPPHREDSISILSGVDCLTCHVKEGKVITRASFKPSGKTMEGQCSVTPSGFFSNTLNCVSCHNFAYKHSMKSVEDGIVKIEETDCLKCHQEYDDKGKGTHYYYWKHDPPQKKRKPEMELFDCVSLSIKNSEEINYVVFQWQNRHSPHTYPDCAEYIVELRLLLSDADTLLLGMERINRRQDDDPSLKKLFKGMTPPGETGYPNYPRAMPLTREYPINKDLEGRRVLVTIKLKTQYWAYDAEARELDSRLFEL